MVEMKTPFYVQYSTRGSLSQNVKLLNSVILGFYKNVINIRLVFLFVSRL
jgi:hypothetical protein